MTTMVLLGGLIGAGLAYLLLRALPAPSDPLTRLARFDAQRHAGALAGERPTRRASAGLQSRVGGFLAPELHRFGVRYERLRQDLVLSGMSFEDVIGRKALVGVGGLVFALLSLVLLARAGLHLPAQAAPLVALGCAAGGFVIPDFEVRARALKRREQFHQALSVYLRWVALQMASQASVEGALPDAASVGVGWPLRAIASSLQLADRTNEDPWRELGRLGDRIGSVQLHDLAVLIGQASADGARIRETLAARADSMQAEQLAAVEEQSAKRSQAMILAQLLVALGFMAFLGYPSIQTFLAH